MPQIQQISFFRVKTADSVRKLMFLSMFSHAIGCFS